jgi:hypothetical protein
MWRPALRRFGVVLVALVGFTAVLSLLFGLALGASVSRSISIGLYLVGAFVLAGGFFIGNRGPIRLRGDSDDLQVLGIPVPILSNRRLRVSTQEEREETINQSAVFVSVGLVLIVFGVLADTRFPLY